jgi:hypothetical protein
VTDLLVDHYSSLRNASTGRISVIDLSIFVGVPAAAAAVPVVLGASAGRVPELLSTTAIFTGLTFGAYVLMFDMTMRATDHTDPARRGPLLQLAAELRANISYAVLVGLALSALLAGFVMFAESDRLPTPVTAIVVFAALQLMLTIAMVLKRVRALYRAYPAAQRDRVP